MKKQLLLSALAFVWALVVSARENNTPTPQSFFNKKAPLSFMENKGQITDQNYQPRPDIQFQLKAANGLTIFVGDGAIHYQFVKADRVPEPRKPEDRFDHKQMMKHDCATYSMYRMDVELIGANKHAKLITEDKQDYYENYYTTGTGENGATVYAYSKITYKDIYPNIDWVLYTRNGELKHEFILKQGGNPDDIKLKYSGATNLQLHTDGSLEATTPEGTITEKAPVSYTQEGQQVKSSFNLKENVLSYEVGNYEGTLVIDPSLVWATYIAGESQENLNTIDVLDTMLIIAGGTMSLTNIATIGAFQTINNGNMSAFVSKYSSTGIILWSTYIVGIASGLNGTAGWSEINNIIIDSIGNIYFVGHTGCDSAMATTGAYQTIYGGDYDAFIGKFSNNGNRIWCTYVGGNSFDRGRSITIDKNLNIISTLYCNSSGLSSNGAFQSTYGGSGDVLIIKLTNNGLLKWSTYYGGGGLEWGALCKVDMDDNLIISGESYGPSILSTNGAFQTNNNGGFNGYDAFIAKFDSLGNRIWGTYFGGNGDEYISGLTISKLGNIYLSGRTGSTTNIATSNTFLQSGGGSYYSANSSFIEKFSSNGIREWGTYFPGSYIGDIRIDTLSNIYFVGSVTNNFSNISTYDSFQPNFFGGGLDCYIQKFNDVGQRLWGSYYGGEGYDEAYNFDIDNKNNLYIIGNTTSFTNISTVGSSQPLHSPLDTINYSNNDGFIARINFGLIANAGSDKSICFDENTGIGSNHEYGHLYTWSSSPSGFFSSLSNPIVSPSVTTTYFLKDSLIGISAGYDTVTVTVNPLPIPQISHTFKAICPGGDTKVIASGGTTYLWSNGQTTDTATFTQAGNYKAIVTNTYGCVDSTATVQIQVKNIPTIVIVAPTLSACQGEQVTLSLYPNTNIAGFDLQWTVNASAIAGATSTQYSPSESGSYSLSVTGGSNCTNSSVGKTVIIKPIPTASYTTSGSTNLCTGDKVTLTANMLPVYTNVNWLKNGIVITNSPTYKANTAGDYQLVVNQNGCRDTSAIVTVTINPKPVVSISTLAPTICSGNTTMLTTQTNATGLTYQWLLNQSPIVGATDADYVTTIGGIYRVIANKVGCTAMTNNQKVTVNATPAPTITPQSSTTIGINGSVKLTATYIANATYQWYWNNTPIVGATKRDYKAIAGGDYKVEMSKLGCTGISAVTTVTQTSVKEEAGVTSNPTATEEAMFELVAYPNPVTDLLTINVRGLEAIEATIQVMDFSGRLVAMKAMTTSSTTVDMTGYANGMYLIRYKDAEGRTGTIKITKE